MTPDEAPDPEDPFEREDPPRVKRKIPVHNPQNQREKWGYIGVDNVRARELGDDPTDRRQVWVYSSPRKRSENYFRKIGGYPITAELLDHLVHPDWSARYEAVEIVYIIQRERGGGYPAGTVFEFHVRTYLEAEAINYPPFGEQRCPPLDDADAVWPALGGDMFITGSL